MSEIPAGKKCVSNELFAASFPRTLARQKKAQLHGVVLGKARTFGCYKIQWAGLKTPWELHEQFFGVSRALATPAPERT